MAKQVERVGVRLARLRGDLREINAALGQLLDDVGALAGISPAGAQFVRAGAERAHLLGGVVGELDDAKLFAIGIKFVDEFGGDFHLAAVEIEFAPFVKNWINGNTTTAALANVPGR